MSQKYWKQDERYSARWYRYVGPLLLEVWYSLGRYIAHVKAANGVPLTEMNLPGQDEAKRWADMAAFKYAHQVLEDLKVEPPEPGLSTEEKMRQVAKDISEKLRPNGTCYYTLYDNNYTIIGAIDTNERFHTTYKTTIEVPPGTQLTDKDIQDIKNQLCLDLGLL